MNQHLFSGNSEPQERHDRNLPGGDDARAFAAFLFEQGSPTSQPARGLLLNVMSGQNACQAPGHFSVVTGVGQKSFSGKGEGK
jgi:hypothetical protein